MFALLFADVDYVGRNVGRKNSLFLVVFGR